MFKRKDQNKRMRSTDNLGYKVTGRPSKDNEVNDFISKKALKDMPKSSYSFAADPYNAAPVESRSYPLLNTFNKVIGGSYKGDRNIDGGNVQQYANSTTSDMLKVFDEMRLKINVNYRYLPCKARTNQPGLELVNEMRKSIAESVSILNSTTFTQLAITDFAVETDLPMGSATTVNIANGNTAINAYTNTTDVLYAMSIYYQLFLQNSLGVMNYHNSFRLKQGVAIKNAWEREVPNLNAFFGLMNKSSFLSLLESINLSFEGEYVDTDFMKQMNTLGLIPSRRSDSINDPVLELQLGWNHPSKFKVYLLGTNGKILDPNDIPLFNDADLKLTIPVNGIQQSVDYWTACDSLRDYLSLEATQEWARSNYTPAGISGTDAARFNQIKSYFDVINASFTIFKPLWSDFRECLDTMVRTGAVTWTKGFRPGIVKDTDVQLVWNVMIDNIYQMIFSGAHTLDYDDVTKRWRTFSLWNMYTGIPEYDAVSGGSFLTLSFKEFSTGTSNEQYEYLPLLFEPFVSSGNQVGCVALSRDGKVATISQYDLLIRSNVILRRLAPLSSQSTLKMRVPTIAYSSNSSLDDAHFSNLYKVLTQIFGVARIQYVTNGTYDIAIDPDVFSIYQIELADVTNLAITYARANAPFRGTTSNLDLLGFATT